MIAPETIQRIMDATRIEEVIGEFVSMKKRGTNYIACCPFHDEKTPSFSVSPTKNLYKCFGCGESGTAVGFLMKHEHYTYPEALKWLAKKYHIEIEEEEMTAEQKERQTERDGLFHVSEFAQKYFAQLLYEDEMGKAVGLSYFHGRGLTDKVIKDFGLGYSLDVWDNFTKHARKSGYSDNVLQKTGLTIFKDDGKCYDRFKGRVMFPIYSVSGRVLGFSGRILSKEKQAAKYVNSPDSEIYNKSHILYGLYQAKNSIAKQDKVYLVEGNIDVISMYQSGVENTVASCGTSLTVEQVRLMRRYTKNVTVLYDGDKAGIKAAFRAVNMLFEEGLHVRVVLFPDGDDPDSYAQKYGSTKLQEYLKDNETNFILFKTKVLAEEVKNDPIRKAEVLGDIVRTIALVPDLLERTEYVKLCASLLHTPENTLQIELAKVLNRKLYDSVNNHKPDPADKDLRETGGRYAHGEVGVPAGGDSHGEVGVPAGGDAHGDVGVPAGVDAHGEVGVPVGVDAHGDVDRPMESVVPFSINPAKAQELKLISLLLNYGDMLIAMDEQNEKGEKIVVNYTVAQIVVGDVLGYQLTFEEPQCQIIFNEYAKRLEQGEEHIDTQLFVNHEDAKVRELAISLMMENYQISDKWLEDKHIYVPKPEDRIRDDVEESLFTFELKKLNQRISNIDIQFPYAKDDDERLMLMAQKMQLQKAFREIGTKLNRVIC